MGSVVDIQRYFRQCPLAFPLEHSSSFVCDVFLGERGVSIAEDVPVSERPTRGEFFDEARDPR